MLLCAAAVCSILAGTLLAFFGTETSSRDARRTLSFAQRVAYQRAIEDVYWRHRIWPKENPKPKPSVDEVMPRAQLEKKVTDYLRKSQALEDYWQRPLTAKQLQGEVDRMAKNSKQPDVLREVFAALGNDPFVIAECLARAVLAERLNGWAVEWHKAPQDSSRTGAEIQMSEVTTAAQGNYSLPAISDGPNGCTDDTWVPTSLTKAPTSRHGHTAVWTGSEMIVWGGSQDRTVGTGARYNPSTDSWGATTTTNAPCANSSHTAVWTGTEMIVWGGSTNTGGKYNPATGTWTPTNTANAPAARYEHTAVWTGSQMIVWGGVFIDGGGGIHYFNTGGRYDPDSDTWTATTTTNAPSARGAHTAIWTGSEMVVWGGVYCNPCQLFNTGGRYNPSDDSWTATSTTNAPDPRFWHTAVWAGSEMIVWGGYGGSGLVNSGGRYNPGTNSWIPTTTTNAPSAREIHTAVWTGSEMLVWGGFQGNPSDSNIRETYDVQCGLPPPTPTPTATVTASPTPGFGTGGRYHPGSDSWRAISTTNAPAMRYGQTAIWTGNEMIVWGGVAGVDTNTGGRYCAQFAPTATATPTPTATATMTPTATPAARPNVTPRTRPSPPPRP